MKKIMELIMKYEKATPLKKYYLIHFLLSKHKIIFIFNFFNLIKEK